MNVENNHRENSSLMERKNIEGTPFYMWGDYKGEKAKYYITLGDTKVTEDCDSAEEAMKWKEDHYWEFMMSVMVCVIKKTQEIQKLKEIMKKIPQG